MVNGQLASRTYCSLILLSIASGMEQNFNILSIGGKQLRSYFYVITIKIKRMKKLFLLATAALLVTGVTFADNGKKKKDSKKSSCSKSGKSCSKDKDAKEKEPVKEKTANL